MSAPAPVAAGYVRAKRAVPVFVDQPVEEGVRRFRGRLLGAMFSRGDVHHFRVEGDDGVLYLTPPHWLVGIPPLLVLDAAHERQASVGGQAASLEVVL